MKQSQTNNRIAFKVTTNQFNDGTSSAIIKDDVLICSEVDKSIINDALNNNYLIEHSKNNLIILSGSKRFKNKTINMKLDDIKKAYIINELKRGMAINNNL